MDIPDLFDLFIVICCIVSIFRAMHLVFMYRKYIKQDAERDKILKSVMNNKKEYTQFISDLDTELNLRNIKYMDDIEQ